MSYELLPINTAWSLSAHFTLELLLEYQKQHTTTKQEVLVFFHQNFTLSD